MGHDRRPTRAEDPGEAFVNGILVGAFAAILLAVIISAWFTKGG